MKLNLKRILSALLVLVLVFSMVPVTALAAANNSRRNDTIFFGTDLHQLPNKLTSLLKGLDYEPGLVVLGGDYVDNKNPDSLYDITSKIHAVYPNAQTFYTYTPNDVNVAEDGSNRFAFARTGEYISGEDYYVYAIDQNDMSSVASASGAADRFVAWANSADATKVIFVMCHMPIHKSSGNNAGGSVWMNALNNVGENHDVVFLWGCNHNNETTADTSVYYVARGGSLTPEGGNTDNINFTYVNAGYIRSGNGTMAIINDNNVTFLRYNTRGTVIANYVMERKIEDHTHAWVITDQKAATCGEDGYKTYSCVCGESYTEAIHATADHKDFVETVSPTCSSKGRTTYTCSVCGRIAELEIDALGHDFQFVKIVPPTATAAGYTLYQCSRCPLEKETDYVPATIHTFKEIKIQAPTCTADGYIIKECTSSECNKHQETEVLPALGHAYQTFINRPTCEEDGIEYYICTNPGCDYESEPTILKAQDHDLEQKTIEPTCTQAGSIIHFCKNCDYSYIETLPATGHTEEVVTIAAYCAKNGAVISTCSDCGDSSTEVIPATGHKYEATVIAATCTETGYTKHTCVDCGDYYTSNRVNALGHNYTSEVIAPTCTDIGFTRSTCTTCGDSFVNSSVAALGHNYVGTKVGNNMEYTCQTCGDSYTEEIADGFTYAKATKFSIADNFVITLYSGGKYYALSHKDNNITTVQVTVENNEITSDVTEDMLWRQNSKKLYYKDGSTTRYLTGTTSNVSIGTSGAATITYSSNKLKVGSKYLRFSSNNVSLSTTGSTTYLFKQAK